MVDRTGTAAYIAIMISCVAGILHLSPWAIILSACGLVLLSILNKQDALIRRLGSGATVQAVLMASTVVNASGIAAAGYVLGRGIEWVWLQ